MEKCYVILDKNNIIVSVNEKNNNILEEGQSIEIVNEKFSDFCKRLNNNPHIYKKNGNDFIIDKETEIKRNAFLNQKKEDIIKEKLIRDEIREIAIASLKEKGQL